MSLIFNHKLNSTENVKTGRARASSHELNLLAEVFKG